MGRGRKSKYTPELVDKLIELIGLGATDKAAYDACGINHDTFYAWINENPEFSEKITRARGNANIKAVQALHEALSETKITRTIEEDFTETRLDKNGEPYEYKRKVERTEITYQPADWRAAVEYLKRRDRDNWSDRQEITGKDGQPLEVKAYVSISPDDWDNDKTS